MGFLALFASDCLALLCLLLGDLPLDLGIPTFGKLFHFIPRLTDFNFSGGFFAGVTIWLKRGCGVAVVAAHIAAFLLPSISIIGMIWLVVILACFSCFFPALGFHLDQERR